MDTDNSRVIPMTTEHRNAANQPTYGTAETIPPVTDNPWVNPASLMLKGAQNANSRMSKKYPKYYKSVSHVEDLDIYLVCEIFGVEDKSGALHHAIKKLLLSGVRTGGKAKVEDIKEARDTLTRYLEIYSPGLA